MKAAARPALLATAIAVLLALASCDRSRGGSTVGPAAEAAAGADALLAVPLGDVAGAAKNTVAIANPYGDSPEAVRQGEQLFVKMNCAGCHGYGATGGMGPNLTDPYWRYGGTPAMIFKSIYEGRPQGMPAWNPALPPEEIWKLVAYVESLGGGYSDSQTQAAIQGDRAGDNVAPEVARTLSTPPAASAPTAKGSGESAPGVEARPDAAGPAPKGTP